MTHSDSAHPALELAIFLPDRLDVFALPPRTTLRVGRGENQDVRIDDASVSREHAELRVTDRDAYVRDLSSANGTFVREAGRESSGTTHRLRSVTKETQAAVGSVLHFGTVMALLRRAVMSQAPPAGVVLRDPSMRLLYEQASRAAGALISVLVLGETGVGKEVLARTIHARSPRASGPFVALSCAALPPSLLESELFGHEKGAFTGAAHARAGLIETASGGTLFLDEIGELPMDVQVKLLRAVEERTVLRVGARAPRPIDVRFIAATNRDLEAECARGTFRTDLYFRLNGMSLWIPPLRDRPEDLMELARAFLATATSSMDSSRVEGFSTAAGELLRRHRWPGNVRELRNVVERAVVLCDDQLVQPEHLPEKLTATTPTRSSPLHDDVAAHERTRVLEALDRCGGNQTKAAEMLGVSRRTLVSRLSSYGLTRPRK